MNRRTPKHLAVPLGVRGFPRAFTAGEWNGGRRRGSIYIDVFTDDPRLTPEKKVEYSHGRGGSGIATPTRGSDDVWLVRRDIVLGKGVPGYPPKGAESQ